MREEIDKEHAVMADREIIVQKREIDILRKTGN